MLRYVFVYSNKALLVAKPEPVRSRLEKTFLS